MGCSMPGFPVHHQLPELAQAHVHRVGDAIQPSHPLLPLLLPSVFLSHRVFSNESVLLGTICWPKYWAFSFSISPSNEYSNEYSGLISFKIYWLDFLAEDSQESSPIAQFKNINSIYDPTLTYISLLENL